MATFTVQVQQAIAAVRQAGPINMLGDQLGNVAVSEILPRYAACAWSNLLFFGANNAAQALSVNSATFTGLAIGNPVGSGKNLIIVDATIGLAAALTAVNTPRLGYAATVALTTGASTGPKGLSALVGSGANSVATVGASATLGAAPTPLRPIGGAHWITANVDVGQFYAKDEVAGAIIIPPGQMLTFDSAVGAVSVVAAASWLEMPAP